jgi:hypothetical protein
MSFTTYKKLSGPDDFREQAATIAVCSVSADLLQVVAAHNEKPLLAYTTMNTATAHEYPWQEIEMPFTKPIDALAWVKFDRFYLSAQGNIYLHRDPAHMEHGDFREVYIGSSKINGFVYDLVQDREKYELWVYGNDGILLVELPNYRDTFEAVTGPSRKGEHITALDAQNHQMWAACGNTLYHAHRFYPLDHGFVDDQIGDWKEVFVFDKGTEIYLIHWSGKPVNKLLVADREGYLYEMEE